MSKISIIGKLTGFEPGTTKDNQTFTRLFIGSEQFDRHTGQLVSQDSFEILVFNGRIHEADIRGAVGKKVVIECFLNGRMVERNGRQFNNLTLSGYRMEIRNPYAKQQ